MKRLWLGAGLLLGLLALPATAIGAEKAATTKLFLDGKELVAEVPPKIIEGNTFAPVRIIAENLGAKVEWDEPARQVTVTRGTTTMVLTIDKPEVKVGAITTKLEVAPMIVEGSTMLPVRFISEQLGLKVTWDDLTSSVFLYNKSSGPAPAANTGANAGKPTTGVAHAAEPNAVAKPGTVQTIEFKGDRLTINTTGVSTKPNLFHLSNPERLVLDVPFAALSDSLKAKLVGTAGEIALDHPLGQKIRFSNYSSDPATTRIIIDLKARSELTSVDAKQLKQGQFAYDLKLSKFRVVVDAGHGDHDSGAISLTGRTEKSFNLSVATKVNALLRKEKLIEPLMTRTDDTFVELNGRVDFANSRDADLFLSIHGNKWTASTSGTETYYYRSESVQFANTIHKHLVAATGLPDRHVRNSDFRVVKYTTMPAVLVEVGYLSNKTDEKKMYDDAFQNQVAASLVAGIKDYLNIQ